MKYIYNQKKNSSINKGETIYCYGKVEIDSNYLVVWTDKNDYAHESIIASVDNEIYNTWNKVCDYLLKTTRSDCILCNTNDETIYCIDEISSC